MTRLKLAARETFRSLHTPNFRLFFVGQIISHTGTWMEMIAVIWLVLQLTDSGVALGLVTAAQFGPLLLLGAWTGLLADRADRHHLMLTTQVLFALSAALLAVLVVTDHITVTLLYVFAASFGVITAIDNPTRRALVNDLVASQDVPNAVGLNSAIMTGARVAGPTIAGLLIAGPGVEWCFVVNALSYLAVIWALTRMNRETMRRSPRVARAKGQLREGFAYVRRTPELLLPLVLVAVAGTLAMNYPITLPLLAERSLGGDVTTFTMLYATMSAGSVMGALQVARRRDVAIGVLVRAGMGLAVSILALAMAPATPLATAAALAVGFHMVFLVSGSNTVVQLRADPLMRGRVLALFSMVFLGSKPIGGPLVGWVSEAVGPRVGVAVGGLGMALGTAWVLHRVRHHEPAEPSASLRWTPALATGPEDPAHEVGRAHARR
jgi:MFS family permease